MRDDDIILPLPPPDDRPGDLRFPKSAAETSNASLAGSLTWRGKRHYAVLFSLGAVAVVSIAVLTLSPWAVLFKPGPLSKSHAQIMAGTVTHQRCAACHNTSSLSPIAIFSFEKDQHHNVQQSELCLKCHGKKISPGLASAAHNLSDSVRDELTDAIRLASTATGSSTEKGMLHWIPDSAVDQNNVKCSVCHKEHHGSMFDLTAVGNDQCQTCHSRKFDRFAGAHPDWDVWPYGRGGEIAFDHGSHSMQHFSKSPRGSVPFDCSGCHAETLRSDRGVVGELARSGSYEVTCAECHNDSLRVQLSQGFDFLSLPMIPESIATKVTGWPESAVGFTDGTISPVIELLLRGDEDIAEWLRKVPDGDLSRLPESDPETNFIVARLAIEIQTLMTEISQKGQVAIEERLVRAGLSTHSTEPLLRSLSPQLIDSARERWGLGTSGIRPNQAMVDHVRIRLVGAGDDDLLTIPDGGDLLLGAGTQPSDDPEDSLLLPLPDAGPVESIEKPTANRIPEDLVKHGGWYRDDTRMSIRYRGSVHADEVFVSLIATFSQLSRTDPLRQRFFDQTSVAACISCHRTASDFPSRWTAERKIGQLSSFTKFSHGPHLNVSALGRCEHCHTVSHDSSVDDFVHDFSPLGRDSCAACHTANAAGDRCTQCHRYHIQR